MDLRLKGQGVLRVLEGGEFKSRTSLMDLRVGDLN